MSAARILVVNADDLGMSTAVNRGVIHAFERGIVTSASLAVRWPAAAEAAAYGRTQPELGLGLHVDLGEWVYDGDAWQRVYEVVDVRSASAVAEEVRTQLDRFRALVGRSPTHLDSHQHIHRDEPVREVVAALALELGIPARDLTPGIAYRGSFYGQTGTGEPLPEAISTETLVETIRSLPPGVTELGCHPGTRDDELRSPYLRERELELEALCSPLVRSAVAEEGIELRSFASLSPSG